MSKKKLSPQNMLRRSVVFFIVLLLFCILLYAYGNYQFFLDKTQTFLLRLISALGALLSIFSISAAIYTIVFGVVKGYSLYGLRSALYFLTAALAACISFFAILILVFSSGYSR